MRLRDRSVLACLALLAALSAPAAYAQDLRTPRTRGVPSSPSDNVDNVPDPPPPPPPPATAKPGPGPGPLTLSGATVKHVTDLQNIQAFFASLGHLVTQLDMNVALIGGNKYMVANCLGIKASVGEFSFRPGPPSLRTDGSGILMEFAVSRINLNGLMVRVRPNAGNPANLCHFSKRFGVGGSASNVRFTVRFDPLLDLQNCKVTGAGQFRQSFAIGGLNLKPLQNDLDKVAKHMIEEAINLYLDAPIYQDLLMQATTRALQTTCTAGL